MSIIPQDTTTENCFQFTVDTFLKKFKVGSSIQILAYACLMLKEALHFGIKAKYVLFDSKEN